VEFDANHSLKLTSLEIRKMDDRAGIATGLLATENVDIRMHRLEWLERKLLSHQLEGEHFFEPALGNELKLTWHYNQSSAQQDAPDTRQHRYDLDRATGEYE